MTMRRLVSDCGRLIQGQQRHCYHIEPYIRVTAQALTQRWVLADRRVRGSGWTGSGTPASLEFKAVLTLVLHTTSTSHALFRINVMDDQAEEDKHGRF